MRWVLLVAVTLALLAGAAGAPGVAGTATQSDATAADRVSAGTALSASVVTHQRTLEGDLAGASLRARLDGADAGARARILDQTLANVSDDLQEIEAERRDRAAGDDGNATSGAAALRAADEVARLAALDATLNESDRAIDDLPEEAAAEYDLETRLADLRQRTDGLLDGETRERAEAATGGDPDRTAPLDTGTISATLATLEGTAVPPPVRGERLSLHVRTANGTVVTYALTTDGGTVGDVERGAAADPTMRAYADHGVIRDVRAADDPGEAFRRAVADGRVTFDGVGLLGSLLAGLARIAAAIGSALAVVTVAGSALAAVLS